MRQWARVCASLRGIAPVLTNLIITNPGSKTVGKKLKAIKRRGVESLFQKIGVSDGTLDVEYEVRPASRSVDRGAASKRLVLGCRSSSWLGVIDRVC